MKVKIWDRVNFIKSVWGIKGMIEKGAVDANKDFFQLWLRLAKAKISEFQQQQASKQKQKEEKQSLKESTKASSKAKRLKDKEDGKVKMSQPISIRGAAKGRNRGKVIPSEKRDTSPSVPRNGTPSSSSSSASTSFNNPAAYRSNPASNRSSRNFSTADLRDLNRRLSQEKPSVPSVSSISTGTLPPSSEMHYTSAPIPMENRGLLGSSFSLPGIGIEVSFGMMLAILFISLMAGSMLLLNWRVHSLESEIQDWQSSYHQLEDRALFLQTFGGRMAQYLQLQKTSTENGEPVPDLSTILEDHWVRWKASKGIEWKLAEWNDEIMRLRGDLVQSLERVDSTLGKLHFTFEGQAPAPSLLSPPSSGQRTPSDGSISPSPIPFFGLSQRVLEQMVQGRIDHERISFAVSAPPPEDWSFFQIMLLLSCIISVSVIVLSYTSSLWKPLLAHQHRD